MIRAFIEGIGHDWPSDPLNKTDLLDHAREDLPNDLDELIHGVEEMTMDSDDDDEEDEY